MDASEPLVAQPLQDDVDHRCLAERHEGLGDVLGERIQPLPPPARHQDGGDVEWRPDPLVLADDVDHVSPRVHDSDHTDASLRLEGIDVVLRRVRADRRRHPVHDRRHGVVQPGTRDETAADVPIAQRTDQSAPVVLHEDHLQRPSVDPLQSRPDTGVG